MPIQFPSTPTNGQVYSGYYYDATLSAWKASPISAGPIAISDTAPAGAIHGDMWYKSNDGTTYIYYNDGNTSQWVEVRSQFATSQVGLAPVIPTSVAVSSGTASVSVDGTITYSGVGTLDIFGVFSSTYRNYRLIAQASTTANPSEWQSMQFITNSTVNSALTYAGLYAEMNQAGGFNTREVQSGTGSVKIWPTGNYFGNSAIDFYAPNVALFTHAVGLNTYAYASGFTAGIQQISSRENTAYTGIRIMGTGMGGVLKFYGYN